MRNSIVVVGNGALAQTFLDELPSIVSPTTCGERHAPVPIHTHHFMELSLLDSLPTPSTIVLHAGSGRELPTVVAKCNELSIPVIQASTGIDNSYLPTPLKIAIIDAPNLAIPIVKFMYALEQIAPLFREYEILISESHQASKKTIPGTARAFASALGVPDEQIRSVRDVATQQSEFNVPESALKGHAIHRIEIEGQGVHLSLGTRILGRNAYCHGVIALASVIDKVPPGVHRIVDLAQRGLI